ncbi:MAG: DUF6600 domain-containing protein [Terriglobales bacterium]
MKSFRRWFYAGLCISLLAAVAWSQDQSETPSLEKPSAGISASESDIPPAASPSEPSANAEAPSAQIPEGDPSQDPTGRVARLQYMSGQVSVQPHGVDDWVQGEKNRPLTNADNVWADKDSRAELNLGTGLLRINSETSLTLTNVGNDAVQVSLHQGTLNVHVRHLYSGEVWEIDTPNLAFTIKKTGEYRFDVDPSADTTFVSVWKGEGEATGQGPSVSIHEGEQLQFSNGNSLTHEAKGTPSPDAFDEWCRVRDQRSDHSVSAKYVAPGMVGTDDLDEYGAWKETPDYGPVWVPTSVSPGWAPYSAGNWIYESPWGWTWVDSYPWGFAPFHYGRWVSWGGGWGWAPGPYWARPWYAPALVGWFGGPRWGVGFGFGGGFGFGFGRGFGWCPLGFREPFYPWYRTSRGYFRNVNISNTRINNINRITNNYYNHGTVAYGAHGGLPRYASTAGRAMSRDNFAGGRPVAGNSVRLSAGQLSGASVLNRVNASPTRQSMLGSRTAPASARPSQAAFSRPTVSRMTPPSASARSFGSGHTTASIPHNAATPMAHGVGSPTGARTGNSAMSSPSSAGRYVPRPPQGEGRSNTGLTPGRGVNNTQAFGRNVPRPSSASGTMSAHNSMPYMGRNFNSVPRPSGPVQSAPHTYSGSGNYSSRGYGGYGGVPRPNGYVRPAPHSYSSSGNYSSRAYGGYGSSGAYSSPRYGGGSPYRGYGSYSNHGSYSAPSHSSGGYSGGGGYHGSSGGGFHGGGGGGGGGGGSHGGGGGGSHGGGGGHR